MDQDRASESPFLDTETAAAYLHLKKATLERWRSVGGGPVFYKLGGRCFYRAEDLDAFALSCRRRSTSDPGDAPAQQAPRSAPTAGSFAGMRNRNRPSSRKPIGSRRRE